MINKPTKSLYKTRMCSAMHYIKKTLIKIQNFFMVTVKFELFGDW